MNWNLKPLAEQTLVVTGATSGHGLCTVQMAAARGARVMLVARDEAALRQIVQEIRGEGGTADFVVADVGNKEDVDRIAQRTIERFGGFDTWVNNAGVGVYSKLLELPIEDHRQLFETNYWGVVYGSTVAANHLKDRTECGAIINVGSINSDMSGPILAAYNASKHAVKGLTDALRIELANEGAPVSVTLIKPSAIGTPFPQHGRNLTGFRARLPRPMYAPELVAEAILDSSEHPRRAVTVGGAGKLQVLGATILPWLYDRVAGSMATKLADPDEPSGHVEGNLYAPQHDDGKVEGRQHGRSMSVFSTANRHPKTALSLLAVITGLAAVAVTRRISRS